MVANFSKSERGVRPGASGRKQARKLNVQAVGQKGNKNVRLDPPLQGVKDRAQAQVVFEVFEGRFHLGELNVKPPQLFGFLTVQVAAQQITSLASPHLAQLVLAQLESEIGRMN